jgi:hypothetical protein
MNLQEKISYIIGRDMAANLTKQGIEIEAEAFMKGLKKLSPDSLLRLRSRYSDGHVGATAGDATEAGR